MKLVNACNDILSQLSSLVEALTDEDFTKPSRALSNSTIGQHLRHTLEFFICFEQGCNSGVINYDKRSHDKLIETDRQLAAAAITRISSFVSGMKTDVPLVLEVSYEMGDITGDRLQTTTSRELVYNIEHAVHHMAIIKIGVNDVAPHIKLPSSFGIAASTIRHRQNHADVAH